MFIRDRLYCGRLKARGSLSGSLTMGGLRDMLMLDSQHHFAWESNPMQDGQPLGLFAEAAQMFEVLELEVCGPGWKPGGPRTGRARAGIGYDATRAPQKSVSSTKSGGTSLPERPKEGRAAESRRRVL
eukprot:TRINITY_DN41181_c0_g1_i1.p1 TRINITY_DN41181_c0_g1~~TRINITY_DN41181_c0_g1_i1.p1  ORF type:complete len:138 (-),score=8.48 TRINITY_DN41181_c0_g1_i1:79-462(-)